MKPKNEWVLLSAAVLSVAFWIDLTIPLGAGGGVQYAVVILLCLAWATADELIAVACLCGGLTFGVYVYAHGPNVSIPDILLARAMALLAMASVLIPSRLWRNVVDDRTTRQRNDRLHLSRRITRSGSVPARTIRIHPGHVALLAERRRRLAAMKDEHPAASSAAARPYGDPHTDDLPDVIRMPANEVSSPAPERQVDAVA